MSSGNFDWRTDEDGGWGDPPIPPEPKKAIYSKRLLLPASLAILVIAGLVALGVVGFLRTQVAKTTARLEDDVLASHELLMQAISSYDVDLFETVLSSRSIRWHDLQYELLRRRLIMDRAPLGLLSHDNGNDWNPGRDITITFGPELKTAELTALVPYTVEPPGGITQTVDLERIFHYQQIQNSWLFVPPADDDVFWGKWLKEEGHYLELIFPQRDAEVGSRLAPMLDSLLAELCGDASTACPKDFHLVMKLGREPRNLLRLGDGVYDTQLGSGYGNLMLFLPAPSLIGKPVDEAGFQALYRGYAGWLASVLIIKYNRENTFVDDQFLAKRLTRWGLKPPPWPDQIFPRTVHIELPVGIELPKQDVLMLCGDRRRKLGLWRYVPNSNKWYDELSKIENSNPNDFTPNVWPFAEAMLARMADHRGIFISMRQEIESQDRYRTYLWQDGELRLFLDEVEPYYFIPAIWQSRFTQYGHHWIVFRPISTSWSDGLDPWWFDYQKCLAGNCELRDSRGYPIWSPGGTRSLILQIEDSEEPWLFLGDNQLESSEKPWLLLGDNAGEVIAEVGFGYPVTWLDEDHFVYLRPESESGDESLNTSVAKELVIAAFSGENNELEIVQKIVNTAQLKQAVAEEIRVDKLEIMSALPAPQGFDGWFIMVSTTVDGEQPGWYLFWYHPQQDSVEIIIKLEGNLVLPMTLSPQGRYLAFATSDEYGIRYQIFDIANQEYKLNDDYYPYDWSDDGEWLLFVESDKLRIVGLENGFEWLISHDLNSCYSAVWADRGARETD